MEVEAIKNFFPILEILRKHYMKNFVAPHETFRLPVLNSKKKILFSKEKIKRINFNRTTVSTKKLEKLGWKERYTINDGFLRTIKSYV